MQSILTPAITRSCIFAELACRRPLFPGDSEVRSWARSAVVPQCRRALFLWLVDVEYFLVCRSMNSSRSFAAWGRRPRPCGRVWGVCPTTKRCSHGDFSNCSHVRSFADGI
eukprot:4258238-Prymnesium_polylepis.1